MKWAEVGGRRRKEETRKPDLELRAGLLPVVVEAFTRVYARRDQPQKAFEKIVPPLPTASVICDFPVNLFCRKGENPPCTLA